MIVAFNCDSELEALLPSLKDDELVSEIAVVDHGTGGGARLAREFGSLGLVDGSNPGFGAGQNRGVAATSAEYVLMLNPDAIMVGSALQIGVGALDAADDVAAVQGVIRDRATGEIERSAGVSLRPVHLVGRALSLRRLLLTPVGRAVGSRLPMLQDWYERSPSTQSHVEALSATALLIRRSAFDDVGGFDERYFLYGEDIDLSNRLRRNGWTLTSIPAAWALHDCGATSATSWDRELRWFEGTLLYGSIWWSRPGFALGLFAGCVMAARLTASCPTRWRTAWSTLVITPIRRGRSEP